MRNWQLAVLGFGLGLFLFRASAFAQCTKDTDCRAPRICNNGVCMNPEVGETASRSLQSPAPIPLAPPPGSPVAPTDERAGAASTAGSELPTPRLQEPKEPEWFRGYGNIAGIVSFHSWLGRAHSEDSDTLYENAGYGVHAAGYWVMAPLFHLGAFCDFYKAKVSDQEWSGWDVDMANAWHVGTGVSLKIGGFLSERVWIGGVADMGVQIVMHPSDSAKLGLELFPKFEIDSLAVQSGGVKLGFFGAFGPMFVPWMGQYAHNADSAVALQLLIGLMLGG